MDSTSKEKNSRNSLISVENATKETFTKNLMMKKVRVLKTSTTIQRAQMIIKSNVLKLYDNCF